MLRLLLCTRGLLLAITLCLTPALAAAQTLDPLLQRSEAVVLLTRASDFRIVDANNAALRFYGYSRQDLLSKKMTEVNADPTVVGPAVTGSINEGAAIFQFRHRLADGSIREVEAFLTPLLRGGEYYIASIIHDVTPRREAEQELERARLRLTRSEYIAKVGNWEYDLGSDQLRFSEGAVLILGLDSTTMPREDFIAMALPEQREWLAEAFRRLAAGVSSIQVDFEIVRRLDGDRAYLRLDAAYDGSMGRAFGIVQDMTSNQLFIGELRVTYRFIFALGLVLILVLTVALLSFLRLSEQRRKDEIAIRQLLEEKTVLLREVHHRIKNHMSSAIGLLALQADQAYEMPAAKAGQVLEEAANRLRSVMVLYDKLYRSEDFENLSTREYFTSLLEKLEQLLPSANRIKLEYTNIDDVSLQPRQLSALGIVLNEAVSNAFKYAFGPDQTGKVTVSFSVDSDFLRLQVADNGRGAREEEIEASGGFGHKLIRILAEQLHGKIITATTGGFSVKLVAPLHDADLPLPEE